MFAYSLSIFLTTQIISNTTISRPPPADAHPLAQEAGGLSGKPLFDLSTQVLRDMYIRTAVRALSCFLLYYSIYLFTLAHLPSRSLHSWFYYFFIGVS
mgnify:CR=1 FL=1